MSNTELEEREHANEDEFSKKLDAKYGKHEDKKDTAAAGGESEKKRLDEIADQHKKDSKDDSESGKSEGSPDPDHSIPFRKEGGRFKGKAKKGSLAKKALLGGGIAGGITALIVTLFVSLLPLKLIHIFENLQRHFFATSESAVQNRAERMLSDYLKKKVTPGMVPNGPCSSTRTIDRTCVNTSGTDSAAGRLYNTWRDARLENTLANKYGIEIARVNQSGGSSYKLRINGSDSGVDINSWIGSTNDKETIWTKMGNRSEARQAVRKALEKETYLKRMMYRFKVGRLLERKYGIRRCIFACNTKDKYDDWKDKKNQAAKLILIRRVIIPHTEFVGYALECVITNSCGIDKDPSVDGTVDEQGELFDGDGYERRDQFQRDKIAALLAKNSAEYSVDKVDNIIKIAERITKYDKTGGFSNYLVETIAERISNKFISQAVEKGIPIIGYIDTAARVWTTISDAGPKIKRWTFIITTTAMVSYYMIQASQASEIKSGHTKHEMTGSLVSSFGNTAGKPGRQNQPAENAPLYTAIMGSNEPPQRSIISTMLPSAFAADPANPDLVTKRYTCDNGKQLDTSKSLVCPEESVKASNIFVTISNAFNSPPLSGIGVLADAWRSSIGRILGYVDKFIGFGWSVVDGLIAGLVPQYKEVKAAIMEQAGKLLQALAEYLIPSPISDNMSGARAFDMAAAGADAAGADYAHYGLGARRVTDQVAAQIREEQQNQYLEDFQSRPLFARLFDTEESHSLISQVAMDIPLSTNSIFQNSFASFLSSPFTKLFDGFALMVPGSGPANAAPINDPFGIPQYAYDLNDPETKAAMGVNPESLTDAVCKQMNKDWGNGTGAFAGTLKVDHDTGMDIHTKPNPCLLNNAAAGSAGGYFSTEVLSAGDLGT